MGKINIRAKSAAIINKTKKPCAVKKKDDSSNNKSAAKDKKQLLNKTITPTKTTSKKEKISQKRKNLMNKFTILKKLQKEERARKNREKTAVIGDLKPLKDSLPSLDEIFLLKKENDNSLKTGIKELDDAAKDEKKLSAKMKIKRKKEKFVRQVNSYQQLLKDPDFKKNPREAIRFHIKYTHGGLDE